MKEWKEIFKKRENFSKKLRSPHCKNRKMCYDSETYLIWRGTDVPKRNRWAYGLPLNLAINGKRKLKVKIPTWFQSGTISESSGETVLRNFGLSFSHNWSKFENFEKFSKKCIPDGWQILRLLYTLSSSLYVSGKSPAQTLRSKRNDLWKQEESNAVQ